MVLHRWGGTDGFSFESVPDPRPGPGEVVVELRASSVNRHDVLVRREGRGFTLPSILGMDGAGRRRDSGEDVIVYPGIRWGQKESAPGPGFQCLGDSTDGTYAELISVPEENLFPKPAGLSWQEAAALPTAGVTMHRALFGRARLAAGETVLVLGAGSGASTFAVALAADAGARVLVTSSAEEKIDLARGLGADGGVLYTDRDWVENVHSLSPGGVDVVIDGVGAGISDSLSCLRPGGRVVVFGASGGTTATIDVPKLYFGHTSILASTLGSPRDFAALLESSATGAWRPVIDSTYSLAAVPEAHARLEGQEHFGKIVLENS
jgi:zinc-binding alcohol dehydrogenase/oxidoreductase